MSIFCHYCIHCMHIQPRMTWCGVETFQFTHPMHCTNAHSQEWQPSNSVGEFTSVHFRHVLLYTITACSSRLYRYEDLAFHACMRAFEQCVCVLTLIQTMHCTVPQCATVTGSVHLSTFLPQAGMETGGGYELKKGGGNTTTSLP